MCINEKMLKVLLLLLDLYFCKVHALKTTEIHIHSHKKQWLVNIHVRNSKADVTGGWRCKRRQYESQCAWCALPT